MDTGVILIQAIIAVGQLDADSSVWLVQSEPEPESGRSIAGVPSGRQSSADAELHRSDHGTHNAEPNTALSGLAVVPTSAMPEATCSPAHNR